ncbi:MAG: SET domain-containing protein-lysine N-methyltransferase [Patescibacteria group bacterium]
MLHPDIRVSKSKISAKGLFAVKKIPRYTVVWKFSEHDSRVYEKPALKKFRQKYRQTVAKYSYVAPNGKIVYLLDASKYFNHSCDPNVIPLGKNSDVAAGDIMPGEEITYDYAILMDADEKAITCRCNSRNCRHLIKRDRKIDDYLTKKGFKMLTSLNKVRQPLLALNDECPCDSGLIFSQCHGQTKNRT